MHEQQFSYANIANVGLIEEIYARYVVDPESVEISWRHFFEGMDFASSLSNKGAQSADLRIFHLIQAYRCYGHLMAAFNPLQKTLPEEPKELHLAVLGFKNDELENSFPTFGLLEEKTAPLKRIIETLQKTYAAKIGIEYMGLGNTGLEEWIQKRVEPCFPLRLDKEQKLHLLHNLCKAEVFESFLHTKYVGQKRFSLEGGETLIPMLSALLEAGAEVGVNEVVLGMTHRGRLNVLANILNKSYAHIFHEFEDFYSPDFFEGSGDVKYHKGFEGSLKTIKGSEVAVSLVANPSHLEAVDPVVEGQARAMQELNKAAVPILIHGDAAIAGQGVVYETLQLGGLKGYSTGGTIHIVVNNQIGFTTLPKDLRSTRYCTDIAKSFGAPVFHVDAEDPETCIAAAIMAIEIRQKFHIDVFIDLYCYRKYGHNEGDEPAFTQPLEYKIIKEKQSILDIYRSQLIKEGVLDLEGAKTSEKEFRENLNIALESVKQKSSLPPVVPFQKEDVFKVLETSITQEKLLRLSEECLKPAEGFHLHPKIQRLLQERLEMVHQDPAKPSIDWGLGETLAYASLLDEGKHVRLSGQDCRRGTFSHRHAVWVDQENDARYFPLSHLHKNQGVCDIFNSPLSEYAVLGFEFGYSLVQKEALVIWEAQFGDFANGAQIVIDQYISTSEQKWGHVSALTLLLPHGYEGQGPEHSSGRMERYLQLCGNDNMRIANCSTPAQLFHLLRKQVLNPIKRPLIIFTPKAMLRHPLCRSSLKDFTQGHFESIIEDRTLSKTPARVLLCSGKVYYDLLQEREKRNAKDVALIRVEQLYPFDTNKLKTLLEKYRGFTSCVWVQEEAKNMGAWEYIQPLLEQTLEGKAPLHYAGRARSASPSTGSHTLHKKQLEEFLNVAFEGES